MLKISKPFRYATIIKCGNELINEGKLPDYFKSSLTKLKRVPKNCLRVKALRLEIGEHFDDFIKNQKSIVATFEIIRFKR